MGILILYGYVENGLYKMHALSSLTTLSHVFNIASPSNTFDFSSTINRVSGSLCHAIWVILIKLL